MTPNITLIGDIHGMKGVHRRIMDHNSPTLQIGDCGFNYSYIDKYDCNEHRILGGNHDNYDKLTEMPHYLGNCGMWNGLFYVRGAWSIDRAFRIEGVSWWSAEELTYAECDIALDEYTKAKPHTVISHDCPSSVIPNLLPPTASVIRTRTSSLLQAMFETHQPKLWIFGHYHQSKVLTVSTTQFRCLNEAEVFHLETANATP